MGSHQGNAPVRIDIKANMGTCPTHGKVLYPSRKGARHAAKTVHPGDSMSAYRCDEGQGGWHIGHLPKVIKEGKASRS